MSGERVCATCKRPERFPAPLRTRRVELRPYGPGGSLICFQCATASPDAEAAAKANMALNIEAAAAISPSGSVVIGGGMAPEPLVDPDEIPGSS